MKKSKLQELFNGITQSQQKVNRITEMGQFWCISFVCKNCHDVVVRIKE